MTQGVAPQATILVVDDDEFFRELLVSALTANGHAVVAFDDGALALKHVEEHRVDAVITDIFMPGMEGLEFIRRAIAGRPALPVIVISGGGDGLLSDPATYLRAAEMFGAVKVLSKPFEIQKLLALVAETIGQPQQQTTPP